MHSIIPVCSHVYTSLPKEVETLKVEEECSSEEGGCNRVEQKALDMVISL